MPPRPVNSRRRKNQEEDVRCGGDAGSTSRQRGWCEKVCMFGGTGRTKFTAALAAGPPCGREADLRDEAGVKIDALTSLVRVREMLAPFVLRGLHHVQAWFPSGHYIAGAVIARVRGSPELQSQSVNMSMGCGDENTSIAECQHSTAACSSK